MRHSVMVRVLKQCQKEIEDFPEDIREDLTDLVARLDAGLMISMPISRPMPSVGKGVHELRLKYRTNPKKIKGAFMKKLSTGHQLAETFKISSARGMEAVIKAQLIAGVIAALKKNHITHQELAKRSGLARTAVTGILTGSLQKVTIDRVLRLVDAVGLVAEVKLKKAA